MKTSASSVRLRWRPATTKRGQRVLRQRVTPATPSTTIAVSSSSETTPKPRVANHSACELTPRPPASRPRRCSRRRRSRGVQAASGLEPGRRVVEQERRGARDVRVDARLRRHADRPPRRLRRPSGARDRRDGAARLLRCASGAPSSTTSRGRRPRVRPSAQDRRAAPRDRRRCARASRPRVPAPATAMSPPSPTSTPPATAAAAVAARSHASALAVAPRSSSTPAGTRTVAASSSSSTVCQPGTVQNSARKASPVTRCDDAERRVVAGRAQRAAHRRIDEAAAAAGGVERDAQRLEQQRADRDAFPTCAVDARELAVGPEAAAGAVDRVELALDDGARGVLARPDRRSRSQRWCRARGRRASRASGDDDGRRLRLRGRRGGSGRRGRALCAGTRGGGDAIRCVVRTLAGGLHDARVMAGQRPRGEACEGGDECACRGERDRRRAPQTPERPVSVARAGLAHALSGAARDERQMRA